MDTFSPPKYSMNAFFVRHVAHPKRMKYIQGLNNSKICAVNDVGYLPNLSTEPTFPSNAANQNTSRKKEKAVPFTGMWSTYGLVDNTHRWRSELNTLASSLGLLTQTDLENLKKKKEREEMIKRLQEGSKTPASRSQQTKNVQQANKTQTPASSSGRLNEPLLTGRRASRQSRQSRQNRTGSKAMSSGKKYIVDQSEREAWMLQVLCQILQTDNLVDVQNWLVSANDSEKEKIKHLINQAMKGFEESGRIEPEQLQSQTIFESNEEFAPNSSLAEIENSLQKFDLNRLKEESNHKKRTANILKIDEEPYESQFEKAKTEYLRDKLQIIPDVLTLSDGKLGRSSPQSTVLNLSLQSPKKNSPIENAMLKLETPSDLNTSDYKVEKVKLTMLVKNEKSKSYSEINGDWKSTDELSKE